VNHYVVRVTAAGSHWLVDVPEFERSTEARHLGEVEDRAAELVTEVTGEAPGTPGVMRISEDGNGRRSLRRTPSRRSTTAARAVPNVRSCDGYTMHKTRCRDYR
jgi:hypothetical protein